MGLLSKKKKPEPEPTPAPETPILESGAEPEPEKLTPLPIQ